MKNIHLLPTEKPSRLVKIGDTFFLTSTKHIPGGTFYNIYVINDEKIKEGDKTNDFGKKQIYYQRLKTTTINGKTYLIGIYLYE